MDVAPILNSPRAKQVSTLRLSRHWEGSFCGQDAEKTPGNWQGEGIHTVAYLVVSREIQTMAESIAGVQKLCCMPVLIESPVNDVNV